MWVFPKIMVPQNGWFTMETPIKHGMIWGVFPLFLETPMSKKKTSLQVHCGMYCRCWGRQRFWDGWVGSMEDMEFSVAIFLGSNPSNPGCSMVMFLRV